MHFSDALLLVFVATTTLEIASKLETFCATSSRTSNALAFDSLLAQEQFPDASLRSGVLHCAGPERAAPRGAAQAGDLELEAVPVLQAAAAALGERVDPLFEVD